MAEARGADMLRRVIFQRSLRRRECSHLELIEQTSPEQPVCATCLAEGTRTVHLRMCLTCGAVACCDSSPGRHAWRHYEEAGHPLIRSIEPGEQWVWCYEDRAYLSHIPG